MKTNLYGAKCALRLPQLMTRLGVPRESIPMRDGQSVRCPWHREHRNGDLNPSFNVYRNGTRAKCFTCDFNIDGPEFVQRWLSLNKRDAFKKFTDIAGAVPTSGSATISLPALQKPQELSMPRLWPFTEENMKQLSAVRRISEAAIAWACSQQVLFFASVCGQPSWILTDSERKIAEARRLNGEYYPSLPPLSQRKAHTVYGSSKAWPLGTSLLRRYPQIRKVMLVEGGPDYLAAFHFLHHFGVRDVVPVAMLGRGAGKSGGIDPGALCLLAGKRVRIYPHADADGGGIRSAMAWHAQLRVHGCDVDYFTFHGLLRADGAPAKDLNDMTSLHQNTHFNFSNLLP
ncbi:hypothetical protein [Prosthecobacter sp.]|jgi:hypothetical protein|uniref:hypothetical protein n=1 Tax=Prosthecobacter sp. TaxID=1965333 RepID=UPI0037C548D7